MQRVLLLLAASSVGQWHPENAKIKSLWPASVDMPPRLAFYQPTQYSQRLAVTNGAETNFVYHVSRDDVWTNAPTSFNPNRFFPYRVPGGLENVTSWRSYLGVSFPRDAEIKVWTERVPVVNSHALPSRRWSFPNGTVFVDMLVRAGETFEVRTRTKKDDGTWESRIPYRSRLAAPKGYVNAGKACIECHKQAGASEQYGIVVRGSDGVFSFPVLREGTLETNRDLMKNRP